VATTSGERCRVEVFGEGSQSGPCDEQNLIYRAMRYVADREFLNLPPVQLTVRNEIPFASGLGSSGAAIVAGIALCASLSRLEISTDKMLRYATELEGHADNVAAALLGEFVINCISEDGEVFAVRSAWPKEIKVITVSPHFQLETKYARSILPETVTREDMIYNMQRVALFGAALAAKRYDLLWEAMQDRTHQSYRAQLVPGLAEALATPRMPGLLGIALSGSGPGVVALATHNFEEIGQTLASVFPKHQLRSTIRVLQVDVAGIQTQAHSDLIASALVEQTTGKC